MPSFTGAQRTSIRRYLGWSARFAQVDTRLEMAINSVEFDADAYNLIVSLLTKLDGVSTTLDGTYGRLKALKVGSIELSGPGEIGTLRSEGRRFAGQLASILGVEVRHDAFGGYGPKEYASWGGMSGRGNYWPHG